MTTSSRLPTLFVSHGSPMFALEPGDTGPALQNFGQRVRAQGGVRGIVLMSPHWMARTPAVMVNPQPHTWHDFGGFPQELYTLQYPAPGSPALAKEVQQHLQAAGLPVQADPARPFDHGAWVPLMFLFPQADVPVVQLALPAHFGPRELYAMGQALSDLRDQGVLLVGSGSMTHNLHEFFTSGRPEQGAPAMPYAEQFARWVEKALDAGDLEALLDYRQQAPQAVRAHPTDEHYLTLYFALGAAQWKAPGSESGGTAHEYLTREIMYSHLAMDAIAFQ